MIRNYWWVTRPKRKLILIPDILKIFSAVAEGQKWERNRTIQFQFEEALASYQWKAQNTSKEASGARTYAAMLYMLGLWFEDEDSVQITNAGKELIENNPPVPVLTKQLLDFQYPSPYSLKSQINVNQEFHVQPFRFILRLFSEKNLDELTQNEIAFCLLPFAKKNTDIDKCYQLIQDYRKKPEKIKANAVAESGTTEDNLRNIGNTIVNQLEYTGFFIERDDIKSLRMKKGAQERVKETLKDFREGFIQSPENSATFQMRYGSGLKTGKDYRYTKPEQPKIDPNDRAILLTYYDITLNEPVDAISEELIQRISKLRGISPEKTRKVLNVFAQKPMLDRFEEKYLQLSVGGTATADDFEIKTNGVFSHDGFGFASVWVGNKPRYPDLFIYFDKQNKKHGLIDTKAYKEYTLPLDHKNIMAHTYIPSFKKLVFEGEEYSLAFFNYVAGGFGSGMSKSFRELISMTDVSGSYITSFNLIQLLRIHRGSPFSAEIFGKLFASNQEIIYDSLPSSLHA